MMKSTRKTEGGMIVKDLSMMTWKEIEGIDKKKSIVFAVMEY